MSGSAPSLSRFLARSRRPSMAATCSAVCHGSAAGTSDLPLAFTSKPSPASSSADPRTGGALRTWAPRLLRADLAPAEPGARMERRQLGGQLPPGVHQAVLAELGQAIEDEQGAGGLLRYP